MGLGLRGATWVSGGRDDIIVKIAQRQRTRCLWVASVRLSSPLAPGINAGMRQKTRARLLQFPPVMTLSLTGLLLLLIIAGVCGALGRAIGGGTRGGVIVSIAVGFIGALLGMFIAKTMHLPEPLVISVENHPFPILWSIIGAAVFVALVHLMSGGASRRAYFR